MVIFIAGCFDVITVGHINLLMFAKRIAGPTGMLNVSIDSDDKIKIDKGNDRPIINQEDRWHTLASLKDVSGEAVIDKIYVHKSNADLYDRIRKVKPDYIIVGDDYKEKSVIGDDIANVIYFERESSSTKIIEACRRKSS